MKLIRPASPTSVILRFKLMDSTSTSGAGKTGLTSGTAGLNISTMRLDESVPVSYSVTSATIQDIATLGTYVAPSANCCRFKEINATLMPGVYEVQLADARFTSIATLICFNGAAGLAQADFEIQCENIAVNVSAIAANAIGATQLATGAITNAKFAAGAIDATAIADGAIDAATFAAGAITNAVFAAGAITSATLANNAIGAANIATGAITNAKFAAGAIDATAIASNAIAAAKIASNAITSAKIAAGAITSSQLAADCIGASQIAAGAIAASEFDQTAADKVWATAARALTDKANFGLSGFNPEFRVVLSAGQPDLYPATQAILQAGITNLSGGHSQIISKEDSITATMALQSTLLSVSAITDRMRFLNGIVYISCSGDKETSAYPAGEATHALKITGTSSDSVVFDRAMNVLRANGLSEINITNNPGVRILDGTGDYMYDRIKIKGISPSIMVGDIGAWYPSFTILNDSRGVIFENLQIHHEGAMDGVAAYANFKHCYIRQGLNICGALIEDCKIEQWLIVNDYGGSWKYNTINNTEFCLLPEDSETAIGLYCDDITSGAATEIRINNCYGRLNIRGLNDSESTIVIDNFNGDIHLLNTCLAGNVFIRGGSGKIVNDSTLTVSISGFYDGNINVSIGEVVLSASQPYYTPATSADANTMLSILNKFVFTVGDFGENLVKSDVKAIESSYGPTGKANMLSNALHAPTPGLGYIDANIAYLSGSGPLMSALARIISPTGDYIEANVKSMNPDTVNSNALATDAVDEIQSGLAREISATTNKNSVLSSISTISGDVNTILTSAHGAGQWDAINGEVVLSASQPNYPIAKETTLLAGIENITGTEAQILSKEDSITASVSALGSPMQAGTKVVLSASQPDFRPAVSGDKMDIANVPNDIGVTAIADNIWKTLLTYKNTNGSMSQERAWIMLQAIFSVLKDKMTTL